MKTKIVTTFIFAVIFGVLAWAGERYKDLPDDVTVLKANRLEDAKRFVIIDLRLVKIDDKLDKLEKIDDKLDTILKAVEEKKK